MKTYTYTVNAYNYLYMRWEKRYDAARSIEERILIYHHLKRFDRMYPID